MVGIYRILHPLCSHQSNTCGILLRTPSLLLHTPSHLATPALHSTSLSAIPALHLSTHTCLSQPLTRVLLRWQRPQSWTATRTFCSEPPQQLSHSPTHHNQADAGPGTWQEVYHGVLSTQIKMIKTFSLSTSVLGLCAQPLIFQSSLGSHLGLAVMVGSFMGFFTFVTPFLIHWISKKYVTSLHYHKDRDIYVATTLSFFLRKKKLEFRVADVKVPEVPGPFTTLCVNSRSLFLDPRTFSHLEHYGRLMGYNKPLDLQLSSLEDEDQETGGTIEERREGVIKEGRKEYEN